MLKNRRITVAVTGGIAAYKACEVVRGLVKLGADVRVAMTHNATRFVGAVTFEALSGHPVATSEWEHTPEGAMPHIELNLHADLLLVVPRPPAESPTTSSPPSSSRTARRWPSCRR